MKPSPAINPWRWTQVPFCSLRSLGAFPPAPAKTSWVAYSTYRSYILPSKKEDKKMGLCGNPQGESISRPLKCSQGTSRLIGTFIERCCLLRTTVRTRVLLWSTNTCKSISVISQTGSLFSAVMRWHCNAFWFVFVIIHKHIKKRGPHARRG
jgi:hypothetical protein